MGLYLDFLFSTWWYKKAPEDFFLVNGQSPLVSCNRSPLGPQLWWIGVYILRMALKKTTIMFSGCWWNTASPRPHVNDHRMGRDVLPPRDQLKTVAYCRNLFTLWRKSSLLVKRYNLVTKSAVVTRTWDSKTWPRLWSGAVSKTYMHFNARRWPCAESHRHKQRNPPPHNFYNIYWFFCTFQFIFKKSWSRDGQI